MGSRPLGLFTLEQPLFAAFAEQDVDALSEAT
jgi:hypothetical protein